MHQSDITFTLNDKDEKLIKVDLDVRYGISVMKTLTIKFDKKITPFLCIVGIF